jgi:hypothetical protein
VSPVRGYCGRVGNDDVTRTALNGRPLRVLFFVRDLPLLQRIYAPLLEELTDRGHEIHLAFGKRLHRAQIEETLAAISPERLSYGSAPHRETTDGWRAVAWLVRAVADLARYAHPRYDGAPRLRQRVTSSVLRRMEKATALEPLGRALALRVARRLAAGTDAELSVNVIAKAAKLEEAIPASRTINRFIGEHSPDVVLVTPVVKYASDEVEYLKSARRLGIPAAACVASWDNLTTKGLLKFTPERVFVWNQVQREEASTWHGIPPERVVATGAQRFDKWFEQRPSCSRNQFMVKVGLDPDEPYLAYVCSSPFVVNDSDGELQFVTRMLEALRASPNDRLRRLGVLVRPYPRGAPWKRVDLARFGNAAVFPPRGAAPATPEAVADFYDSLVHSSAVVGINTTAMIEAAIVGKSVLTVLAPEFAQEGTLHFHYLLEENGGFLHVASSLEEHLSQLTHVLDQEDSQAQHRLRFVEAFVRPHGIDRPATPILADAVEELAGLPVSSPVGARTLLLRAALTLEAAACSFRIVARPALRPLRLRLVGAARSRGLLRSRASPRTG